MAKAPRPWTVVRHGPLEKLDDNLWAVEGDVPGASFRRRMGIVRRGDGSLLFFNAVPLADAVLREVTSWGKPAALVVPHEQHMIDARAFAEKLDIPLYGPKACAEKIRARAPMAGTLDALPADPALRIEPIAGVKNGEPALFVTSGSGRVSLLVSDVIMNNSKDAIGFLPRLLGFAGKVKVVPVFRTLFVDDRPALRAQVQRWAGESGLARLVPCHGAVAEHGVAEALGAAAATL